mmetsp:Transcript_13360/g.23599  ORF Transcript_13360/g.23599 Transcript_13360/m.23599 type:complete len:83 (+) Transcript_13360:57-305(+)
MTAICEGGQAKGSHTLEIGQGKLSFPQPIAMAGEGAIEETPNIQSLNADSNAPVESFLNGGSFRALTLGLRKASHANPIALA